MAIIGTHMLFYTSEPEALRAMLRDVFGFSFVDAHDGWLIFALPPAEVGIHPAEGNAGTHTISFMCDDITATVKDLKAKGVTVKSEPEDQGWGIAATLALPGGCDVMVYQPRHAVAIGR